MAPFRYDDKNVVITGASTGMGAETTAMLLDAGAHVYAVDVAGVDQAVDKYVRCDLGDPASITAAAAELPPRVDVLMNCAGIPGKTRFTDLQVLQVNFLGLRMLTEALMPRMPKGSAVVHIASIAGGRWFEHVPQIAELVSTPDFAAGTAWVESNTLAQRRVLVLQGARAVLHDGPIGHVDQAGRAHQQHLPWRHRHQDHARLP